eukprot:g78852.t1
MGQQASNEEEEGDVAEAPSRQAATDAAQKAQQAQQGFPQQLQQQVWLPVETEVIANPFEPEHPAVGTRPDHAQLLLIRHFAEQPHVVPAHLGVPDWRGVYEFKAEEQSDTPASNCWYTYAPRQGVWYWTPFYPSPTAAELELKAQARDRELQTSPAWQTARGLLESLVREVEADCRLDRQLEQLCIADPSRAPCLASLLPSPQRVCMVDQLPAEQQLLCAACPPAAPFSSSRFPAPASTFACLRCGQLLSADCSPNKVCVTIQQRQLQVLQQPLLRHDCGFFALVHALVLMQALALEERTRQQFALSKDVQAWLWSVTGRRLLSRAAYWRMANRLMSALHQESQRRARTGQQDQERNTKALEDKSKEQKEVREGGARETDSTAIERQRDGEQMTVEKNGQGIQARAGMEREWKQDQTEPVKPERKAQKWTAEAADNKGQQESVNGEAEEKGKEGSGEPESRGQLEGKERGETETEWNGQQRGRGEGELKAARPHGIGAWSLDNLQACERSREMQRPHMRFLVKYFRLCQALGGLAAFSAAPSLGRREVAAGVLTVEDTHSLQAVFDSFQSMGPLALRPHKTHAFLVGVGDHWTTVVVRKHVRSKPCPLCSTMNSSSCSPAACSDSSSPSGASCLYWHVEVWALDSNNRPVLSVEPQQVHRLSRSRQEQNVPLYIEQLSRRFPGKSRDELRRLLHAGSRTPFVQSLQERANLEAERQLETQWVVNIIKRCVLGQTSLPAIYLSTLVSAHCSFHNCTDPNSESLPPSSSQPAAGPAVSSPPRPVPLLSRSSSRPTSTPPVADCKALSSRSDQQPRDGRLRSWSMPLLPAHSSRSLNDHLNSRSLPPSPLHPQASSVSSIFTYPSNFLPRSPSQVHHGSISFQSQICNAGDTGQRHAVSPINIPDSQSCLTSPHQPHLSLMYQPPAPAPQIGYRLPPYLLLRHAGVQNYMQVSLKEPEFGSTKKPSRLSIQDKYHYLYAQIDESSFERLRHNATKVHVRTVETCLLEKLLAFGMDSLPDSSRHELLVWVQELERGIALSDSPPQEQVSSLLRLAALLQTLKSLLALPTASL